jgi:transposase
LEWAILRIGSDSGEAVLSCAYSEDLRIRVVRYVEGGASRRSAAKLFGVSPSIAVKWLQRWHLKKSIAPNPVRGHRRAVLDKHTDWLMALVKEKSDITLAEISAKLTRRGVRVSLSTIWSFYDRHNFSFKKNRVRQRAGSSRRGGSPRALGSSAKAA